MNIQKINAQNSNKNVNFKAKIIAPKSIEYEVQNLLRSNDPNKKILQEQVSNAINKIKNTRPDETVKFQMQPLGYTLNPQAYSYTATSKSGEVIAKTQYCTWEDFLIQVAEKFN